MIDAPALVAAARAAALNAHAPYSGFAVGAALLMTDGSIVTGCNVENASYGLSLCAETVAVGRAVTEGRLYDVVAVAIIGGAIVARRPTGTNPVRPCGRCRQVLNEAAAMSGRDIFVFCSGGAGGAIEKHLLSNLLPQAFGPGALGLGPDAR